MADWHNYCQAPKLGPGLLYFSIHSVQHFHGELHLSFRLMSEITPEDVVFTDLISPQSLSVSFHSCCDCLLRLCRRRKELKARTVWLGCPEKCEEKYSKNIIKNQKYNILTFVPGVSCTFF